ncbi:phosphatidate cytidylyltransferase [Streptomyces sp. NPDC047000]|uniref:phosphatidate cytidylyltransferase n=1 Tax=Streptomyces sp. NPDC047000 TaxID=3155474 RepID=UPI0033FB1D58
MITMASPAPFLGGALVLGGIAVAVSRRRELVPRLARTDRVVLAAAVVGVVVTTWVAPGQVLRVVAAGALSVAAVPLLAGDAEHGLRRLGVGLLRLAWLSAVAALVPLGASALALFAAVSIADIVAYFAGPALGGPRLSPLSPAKRWSGTLAGAAAGLGTLAVLSVLSRPTAVAATAGGPAGDLLESMIKRGARIKDAGRWLPGSGGLLDRIDSLLMALAVLLVLR